MFKVFNNIDKFNNNTALISSQKFISYNNLFLESKKIEKLLESNSVSLLIADNHIDFIIGYVAFLNKKNIITILVDNTFAEDFINKILKKFQPDYIYSSKQSEYFNLKLRRIVNYNSYFLYKTDFPKKKNLNFNNFLLLTTSGTTESPKLVRLSRQNLEDNIKNISKNLKLEKNHTTITTMPMGYSYGLSIINTHLYKGAKIVINKSNILEKDFWDKIIKYKVNSFGGVPEFYNFLKKIGFKKKIYPSIKYLTQAGGKMHSETFEYFQDVSAEKNIKFYIMYGQTEASPRMTILDWKTFFKKKNSIGKPFKNCKIDLIDNKKKKIKKPYITGEIVFKGKNVSLGYAKSLKDLKKGDLNKKVLFTGDLAYRDDEGYYFISGRKKKFVKLFGRRFDIKEIENFSSSKGIKIKCYLNDDKLKVRLHNNSKNKNKVKNLISKYLNINPNYILIENKKIRNLKDFN